MLTALIFLLFISKQTYLMALFWNGNNSLLLGRGEDGMLVTTQWGIEALLFLEKLKSPKHSVNGNKIEA